MKAIRTTCRSARMPRQCRRGSFADVMLGFGPVRIAPGEMAGVVAWPQMPFRGRRLAYAGPLGMFVLCDILVGENSQLGNADATAMSMDLFPPLPADLASVATWLNNCGVDEWARPGMGVTLVVRNVSPTSAEFSAVMFGDVDRGR